MNWSDCFAYKHSNSIDCVCFLGKYWKNITYIAPIYGADVAGTLTDNDVTSWNINSLGTILDYVNKDYGISIAGVNTAYVIISQFRSFISVLDMTSVLVNCIFLAHIYS